MGVSLAALHACWQGGGLRSRKAARPETAEYRQIRRDTLDGLGRNSRDTSFLLSTTKGIEVLMRYVKGTRRLEPDARTGVG